jgi:hypothetical protein
MEKDIGKGRIIMSLLLNIANPTSFSAHRAGWGYAMNFLMKYHDPSGILLDDFIDITFGYNYNENKQNKKIPYKKPWIGFLHHPPSICPWYEESYRTSIDINNFLNTPEFQISSKYCQALIVLSDYLKDYLKENIKCLQNVPIITLKHPTETHAYKWNYKKFKALYKTNGLKLINIGYFLRNLSSLFLIDSTKRLEKILLPSHLGLALDNLSKEISFKNLDDIININSVKIIDWQNNDFYDKMLEQSLVFLDLYDTSCNNAVIESIIRSCPLLINRHPATEEYLGKKYPLFYKNINEAPSLIDYDMIQTASEYLSNIDHRPFSGEYFSDNFVTLLNNIGVGRYTHKAKKSFKYALNPTEYELINKTTEFDHRFGWNWVMQQITTTYQKKSKTKTNKLYLNDFTEHVFKIDGGSQIKEAVINDKRYRLIRGYNLFSYKSSDIIHVDNSYYLWHNTNMSWIKYPQTDLLNRDINLLKISTYKNNEWIGFFHNPPKMPKWFDYGQNLENIITKNIDLVVSLRNCKKIFVLSDYLKTHIEKILLKYNLKIPVVVMKHPVPLLINENQKFNYSKFCDKPRLIQLGYWMRKMHSFWQIHGDLEKIWLYGHNFAANMLSAEHNFQSEYRHLLTKNEIAKITHSINSQQTIKIKDVLITKVDNDEYDSMLASSVAYANLYDASANNSVIECIATSTPLLINRIPAVEEYLGEEYPLYFNNIQQANFFLKDNKRILAAHQYLKENQQLKKSLNINMFIEQLKKEIKKICKK